MAENQKERKNRARLIERYKSQQPDRDWDDENGSEDLAGLAADELARFDEDNKKLNELYAKDKRFAGLMNHVVNGGALEDFMLDNFGSEFRDILDAEDGKAKLAERRKKEKEEADRRKAEDDEQDANYATSEKNLKAIKEEYGMTDEQLAEIYGAFRKMSRDVAHGLFDTDAIRRYIKGGRYDEDIANAREEGHIAGKNARARREFKTSDRQPGELPTPEGSGGITREAKPRAKTGTSMFGTTITSTSNGDGGGAGAGGGE